MIRALLWKEWREQRGTLALGCFVMVGFVAIGLQARVVQDIHVLQLAQWLGSLVLPIIVAMGLVAPERSARSLPALLHLPVRAAHMFAVKTGAGALVIGAVLATGWLTAVLAAGNREIASSTMLRHFAEVFPTACMLMVWVTVVGIRQTSEARVGLCGLGFLLGCFFLATLISLQFQVRAEDETFGRFGTAWGASEVVYSRVRDLVPVSLIQPHAWRVIVSEWSWLQVGMAAAVWGLGAWQFGRPERRRG